LSRRYFPPLAGAPKIQGRLGEMRRLITRSTGTDDPRLAIDANEWLMRTMVRHCGVAGVTAVHAYEDCSLWQFREAKRLGKACIYDMPIGYYRAWECVRADLERTYSEWMPRPSSAAAFSAAQKREEMQLADLVMTPSEFVADTVRQFHPEKTIAVAPYGADVLAEPVSTRPASEAVTFLFVGQCSVRKGVPLLLCAWEAAGLKDARLQLVGSWQLAAEKRRRLPVGVQWNGPVSRHDVEHYYRQADVFVFPSNFEGRALAACEALGHGLPVLTTRESGLSDLIDDSCGRIVPSDNLDAMIESLRWFGRSRDKLPQLSAGASAKAAQSTWQSYRRKVAVAVEPYVSSGGARPCHTLASVI